MPSRGHFPGAHWRVRLGLLVVFTVSLFVALAVVAAVVLVVTFRAEVSTWLTSNGQAVIVIAALVGAIVAVLTLFVAIISAFAILQQLHDQRVSAEIAKKESSREVIWRFTDEWRQGIAKPGRNRTSHWSRAIQAVTSESWKYKEARNGFEGEADADVISVLNFFDALAYMYTHGHIDLELSWSVFSSDAMLFFHDSRAFVSAYRLGLIKRSRSARFPQEKDPSYWEDFDRWYQELIALDSQMSKVTMAKRS